MLAPPACAAIRRRTASGPISGWSARAITAAWQPSGTAASPAASEEPMPPRQSGLCTASTQQRDAPLGERLAADLDQRLRPAEPAALARGEQDPGDSR